MTNVVSVVVPVFNEVENVAILAAQIDLAFGELPDYEYECIFVNDGSIDGTYEQIEQLANQNARVHAIHFTSNYGQSAALTAGMRHSKGEYILTLDGDLQNDPADFPLVLELLKEYDCVCGYRAERKDTLVKRISSKIANAIRNVILKDGLRDIGCGLKGFRRVCLEHIISFNGVHRFFPAILQSAGLTITECKVRHHSRRHGTSKYGINNRLWRGIYDLFGVRWLKKRYVRYTIEGKK